MLGNICGHMALFKWSVDNVAFGSGGGLLQKVNRDTQKCAYKCSWAEVDGVARNVQKNPISVRDSNNNNNLQPQVLACLYPCYIITRGRTLYSIPMCADGALHC